MAKFWSSTRVLAVLSAMAIAVAGCGQAGTVSQSPDSSSEGQPPSSGGAATDTIKIAGVWPLTGAFAYNGQASRAGAEYAAQQINEAGGIEALGGAQLEIVPIDTGESAQTAVTATQNALRDADVVAGIGSWLTSFTLASSEVAHREGIPWIAESFGDDVTERDLDFVFDISPKASDLGGLMLQVVEDLAQSQDRDVTRVAVVGDDTPAAVPAQDSLLALLGETDIEVAVQERWSPPLADASAIAQKIASADVDVVFAISYAYQDEAQMVQQLGSRGVDALYVQLGGQSVVPQWRDLGDAATNMIGVLGYAPVAESAELASAMAKALDVPFVQQDNLTGYVMVYVIKEALEQAASTDRDTLRDAIAGLNVDSGTLADVIPGGSLTFDDKGRIVDPVPVAQQWQGDGELTPCTIVPIDRATCDPVWP
jgi:branched-chain amino acid transport system substrate-binding protein